MLIGGAGAGEERYAWGIGRVCVQKQGRDEIRVRCARGMERQHSPNDSRSWRLARARLGATRTPFDRVVVKGGSSGGVHLRLICASSAPPTIIFHDDTIAMATHHHTPNFHHHCPLFCHDVLCAVANAVPMSHVHARPARLAWRSTPSFASLIERPFDSTCTPPDSLLRDTRVHRLGAYRTSGQACV